jgi:hypothetical protein
VTTVTRATCCWPSTRWTKPLTTVPNSASFVIYTFMAST